MAGGEVVGDGLIVSDVVFVDGSIVLDVVVVGFLNLQNEEFRNLGIQEFRN